MMQRINILKYSTTNLSLLPSQFHDCNVKNFPLIGNSKLVSYLLTRKLQAAYQASFAPVDCDYSVSGYWLRVSGSAVRRKDFLPPGGTPRKIG